jgi:Tol biopolymer transport system component
MIGETVGHYRITAKLGQGGMGEVYRARDTKLGREVALKILPAAFAADADRMARFEREAKVLASLNHPNIAAIYGVEERALVMELVEGESPKGPMAFEDAWKIASQIADALEYSHEHGIVHRDLKPANIKVTSDGVVKLLDFGLAKAFTDQKERSVDPEHSPTLTLGATEVGVILGTAAYMSPEQAKGKAVDKRADVWAFGVVLYELLTGERLFKGEDVSDTLASVLRDEPDLPKVPVKARRLLRRCLEKDPKERLRDLAEARFLLDEVPQVTVHSQSRFGWILGGLLTGAVVTFAALWLRPAPPPQVIRFEIHAPPGSTLPLGTPAISPDGRIIAFTVTDPAGVTRIHLRPIDRVETRVLPGTEEAIHPFWSPDGRSLAFASLGGLKRIDVADGSVSVLATDIGGPWQGTWNQYGDILLQMGRISADGGAVTPAVTTDEKFGEIGPGIFHPFFLPDGKRFLSQILHSGKPSIQLATLGSMKRTPVLDDIDSAPVLAPTPQRRTYLLYLQESDLFGQQFDEHSGNLRGKPMLVVRNVGRVANPPVRAAVGVSPKGILAYQAGGASRQGQLTWFDRAGESVDSLPPDASGAFPEISPDGLSVAVLRPDASGNDNIWVTDLRRKSSARVTFGPGRDFSAAWSPDGKRLAFRNFRFQSVHIVEAHDSTRSQVVTAVRYSPFSWSPDGKYLLSGTPARMELVPLSGDGKPIPFGSRNGSSSGGRISPDGKFIAFYSDESGRNEVYVQPMPPAAGQWKVSIDGGRSPRWRRDGKELFFVSPDDAMMAVDIKPGPDFSVGVPHTLFQVKRVSRLDLLNYEVRGDGQQFLIFMPQGGAQDAVITVVMNWWADLRQQP